MDSKIHYCLPLCYRIRCWLTRQYMRLWLILAWSFSGIGGELYANNRFCWLDECAFDVVLYGKVIGTLGYGEGLGRWYVEWSDHAGNCFSRECPASIIDVAVELRKWAT